MSLTSAGKASSQGSFSEGFSEELNEEMGSRRKRESDLVEQQSVEEREEVDGLTDSGIAQPVKTAVLQNDEVQERYQTTDSGIHVDNTLHGTEEEEHTDDLPLPDNSPARHSLHISYLHSESRDSGLSDSPVPFADYSQAKGCKSSPQRHSASGLAQTSMHAPLDKVSSTDPSCQLATTGSSSSAIPTYADEDHDRHMSPSLDHTQLQSPSPDHTQLQSPSPDHTQLQSPSPDHTQPQSPTGVLQLSPPAKPDLPLFDSIPPSKQDPAERIRMISPEELRSPMRQMTVEKFGMKRSQSHGEALSHGSSSQTFSHQTKHGRLIILADNSKQADSCQQPSADDNGDTKAEAAGTSKDSSKGKGKRRKFKSSESINNAGSSPRSHRRTPFFV